MQALWLMGGALAVLAISYRYYSAFIAAKVLALDDARPTPAMLRNDGVLLSRILASRLGVGVGDVVAVERRDGDRRRLRLPVGGVIDDSFGMNATLDGETAVDAIKHARLSDVVRLAGLWPEL